MSIAFANSIDSYRFTYILLGSIYVIPYNIIILLGMYPIEN